MFALNETSKKTTKDLLIEAAFSFYEQPQEKIISLNEIAAKVGITKTAIYRHFKNKDAVISGMQDHFFNLLSSRLIELQKNKFFGSSEMISPLFLELVGFFAENTQYINYFISQYSSRKDFELIMREELKKRGVREEFNDLYSGVFGENVLRRYAISLFCSVSFLYFIKAREKAKKSNEIVSNSNEFAEKLVKFVLGGLKNCSEPGEILYPEDFSEKRAAELDELCEKSFLDIPEENKIFKAFATVIEQYDKTGVTVERIASELNMAKSSLYFYFENKNQMVRSLIEKELTLMVAACQENFAEARNFSEYIYITMRTELEYFSVRPSVLPICGWILQNGTENSIQADEDCDAIDFWLKKLDRPLKKPDLGFKVLPETMAYWTGLIPVALSIVSKKHSFSKKQNNEIIRYLFDFVQHGAGEDLKKHMEERK